MTLDAKRKVDVLMLIIGLIAVILAAFAISFISRINSPKPSATPSPSATIIPSEFPDFDIIQELEKNNSDQRKTYLHLIDNSSTRSNSFENRVGDSSGWIKVKGKLARAYLYSELSVNNKPVSKFESLFVKINYLGGHLFRPNSLPTPALENRSRLLYALNDVSFILQKDFSAYPVGYSDTKPYAKVDWFTYLNSKNRVSFAGFFASQIDGFVDLKLYYQCAPETPDCEVSIEYGSI